MSFGRIPMLTAMVRLSKTNAEKSRVTKCPYCKGAGKPYDKKAHPKKKDCSRTGVATDWR